MLFLATCTRTASFETRLASAASKYCAKLEMCTKSNFEACVKGITSEGVPGAELESELEALINYTETSTCADLMKLVDELR